jgi:hypothetical protein
MIRLKCPKCAHPIAVDDDQAGGVGECDDCGARFRVPAKSKAAVASRRADDDEDDDKVAAGSPRARKTRAADDEDEDDRPRRRRAIRDDDDEDDGDRPRRTRRQSAAAAEQTRMYIRLGIFLAVFVVFSALASLFVTGVGFTIFILGLAATFFVGIAMLIMIIRDDPLWALLIFLFGAPASLAYAIMHWEKVGKMMMLQMAFSFIAACGFVAGAINEGWRETRREARWRDFTGGKAALVQPMDVAMFAGPGNGFEERPV